MYKPISWLKSRWRCIWVTFSPLSLGFVPLRKWDRGGGGFIRLITHLKSESTSRLILGSHNQQRFLKLLQKPSKLLNYPVYSEWMGYMITALTRFAVYSVKFSNFNTFQKFLLKFHCLYVISYIQYLYNYYWIFDFDLK